MQPGHEANMKKRYQALPAFCTASDKSWVGPGNEASPLFLFICADKTIHSAHEYKLKPTIGLYSAEV